MERDAANPFPSPAAYPDPHSTSISSYRIPALPTSPRFFLSLTAPFRDSSPEPLFPSLSTSFRLYASLSATRSPSLFKPPPNPPVQENGRCNCCTALRYYRDSVIFRGPVDRPIGYFFGYYICIFSISLKKIIIIIVNIPSLRIFRSVKGRFCSSSGAARRRPVARRSVGTSGGDISVREAATIGVSGYYYRAGGEIIQGPLGTSTIGKYWVRRVGHRPPSHIHCCLHPNIT